MKSEFLIVAKELMEAERRPMSPRELVDLGLKRQLFSDNVAGKTPYQTMKSKLSVHIRRLREASPLCDQLPAGFTFDTCWMEGSALLRRNLSVLPRAWKES